MIYTRGEYRKTDLHIGDQTLDVSSDGHTVWVNGREGLIGRFCPVSTELVKDGRFLFFTHTGGQPTRENWDNFVQLASQHTLIPMEVIEDHRPVYIPGES